MRKNKAKGFGTPPKKENNSSTRSSHTWVEKSPITRKWRVMAKLNGEDSRCLLVFKSLDQAQQVAADIEKQVSQIRPGDWRNRTLKYQQFLQALPDDDDCPIGVIKGSTDETVLIPDDWLPGIVE